MRRDLDRALMPTVLPLGSPFLFSEAASTQPTSMPARRLIPLALGLLLALGSTPLVASETRVGELDCPPIAGAGDLFTPGTILLVGELHGTDQSPAFTLQIACNAASVDVPVVVGIEVTDAEQERFEAFLDSAGTPADRDALWTGEVWRMAMQYGVTSDAMVDLLDGLRQLRHHGASIRVVLFNRHPAQDGSATRDHRMAEALATALRTEDEAFTVALTGNLHSRVVVGARHSPDFEPMGFVLQQLLPERRIRSLDVAHAGGTAWVCLMDGGCDAQTFRANAPDGMRPGIRWADDPGANGHHGWYGVGAITASPPAFREAAPPEADGGAPNADASGAD